MIPSASLWQEPPVTLEMAEDEVHLWLATLKRSPDEVDEFRQLLSHDEKARADRFHFTQDKIYYTVGRGLLRRLLSRYVQIEPTQLQFGYNQYGKPHLSLTPPGIAGQPLQLLSFNLSHSGELALYGFSWRRAIGVDIEFMGRELEFLSIAKNFFSPAEIQVLNRQTSAQTVATAFYNCWTRKEAYIKAHGMGLSLPLDSFDVTLAPGEAAQLLATRPDASEALKWNLHDLVVPEGYAAALATEGDEWQLAMFASPY